MSYTLVTGGAKSGKSSFSESLLKNEASVCYIATSVMEYPDEEMNARIQHHQMARPAAWYTEERFLAIDEWIKETSQKYDAYLLDCVTIMTTNLFFHLLSKELDTDLERIETVFDHYTAKERQKFEGQIFSEWEKITKTIMETDTKAVIVTNEVGSGIVPMTSLGRWFQDLLGKVNQYLAKEAEQVYFVVCGIPQKIK
ncbi:bifunctional adenosylcobinamide kinase/adenosylcobinamide-phosphate guanylyltransferase [Enterococcus ureasiticus]|uniref:Adenosylcobinamide kinase n=1 Tax=Enterococcus ureasiticus TaxID=903984 RepID=A0A1E5GME5_9ENTE|nr:bifunctional adenosylcobinamide kinase/adenosylcobinamide-phosphate guanylyltransferase [Enterococcus ureasiticus]OEG13864.1 hypothetical protein BCR21_02410 [Enterococcus ureasiticus]